MRKKRERGERNRVRQQRNGREKNIGLIYKTKKTNKNKTEEKLKPKIFTKADLRLLFFFLLLILVLLYLPSFRLFSRENSLSSFLSLSFLSLTTTRAEEKIHSFPSLIYFSLRFPRDSLLLRGVNPFSIHGCRDPTLLRLGFVLP